MTVNDHHHTCNNCGQTGTGTYCSACGQELHVHPISLKHTLHEVVHQFTHFDKGLLFTIKQLITRPGNMQKDFIAGKRKAYQTPFSAFFVSGTFSAFALYWINTAVQHLHNESNANEGHYFQHYFALMQMCLVPVYALVARQIFRYTYNYAEYLVILLYNTSLLFVFVVLANLSKLLFGAFETGYIEAVFVILYNLITYLNIFDNKPKSAVIFKTLLSSVICFAVSRGATWLFIKYVMGH